MLTIFLVGMAEMVLSTLWAKYVQQKSVFGSTLVTVMHVFVWYFVLRTIVDQIDNIWIVVAYAAGCGVGNLLPILFSDALEKRFKALRRAKRAKAKATKEGAIPAVPNLIAHESH